MGHFKITPTKIIWEVKPLPVGQWQKVVSESHRQLESSGMSLEELESHYKLSEEEKLRLEIQDIFRGLFNHEY